MLGYHDCPPNLFETLDDEFDAQWIKLYEDEADELQDTLEEVRTRTGRYLK